MPTAPRPARLLALALATGTLAAGAGPGLTGSADAGESGLPTPVIALGPGTRPVAVDLADAYSVPRSWLGLGFEYTEIPVKSPAAGATLARVVEKLRTVDSHGLVIRVGGDSSNTAGIYTEADGQQGICANVDPDGHPQVGWPLVDARTPAGAQIGVALETGLKNLASTGDVQYLFDADFPAIENGWGRTETDATGVIQRLEPGCVPDRDALAASALGAYPGVDPPTVVPSDRASAHSAEVRMVAAGGVDAVLADALAVRSFAVTAASIAAVEYPSTGFSQNVAARKSGAASAVYAWELGNEPDLDKARVVRAVSGASVPEAYHGVLAPDYAFDFQAFYNQFKPSSGAPDLAGPALGCPAGGGPCNLPSPSWLTTFIAQVHRSADTGVVATGHTYAGASSLATLLNEQAVNIAVSRTSHPTQQAQEATPPIPYRVNEFDSHSTGGLEGVSNSYAASLWMSDALFSILTDNGTATAADHTGVPSGINVHVRNDLRPPAGDNDAGFNVANAPFTIGDEFQEGQAHGREVTVTASAGADVRTTGGTAPVAPGKLVAGSSLYGMLMFVCALGTETSWCSAPGEGSPVMGEVVPLRYDNRATGLRIFAVRVGSHEMRVLFDNKGPAARTPAITVPGATTAEETTLTDAVTPGAPGIPSTCAGNPALDRRCVTSQFIHFEAAGRAVTLGPGGDFVNTNGTPDTTGIPYAHLAIRGSRVGVTVPGYSQELVVVRW